MHDAKLNKKIVFREQCVSTCMFECDTVPLCMMGSVSINVEWKCVHIYLINLSVSMVASVSGGGCLHVFMSIHLNVVSMCSQKSVDMPVDLCVRGLECFFLGNKGFLLEMCALCFLFLNVVVLVLWLVRGFGKIDMHASFLSGQGECSKQTTQLNIFTYIRQLHGFWLNQTTAKQSTGSQAGTWPPHDAGGSCRRDPIVLRIQRRKTNTSLY